MVRKIIGPLLLLPALLFGQYNRPGSTDAQFLKIGVSPRATAMSDAYIAVVNGAEATYYNSAALPWGWNFPASCRFVLRESQSSFPPA